MKISIQIKIVLIYICTIIMIMLVGGTYIVYQTEQKDYENIQARARELAENIENSGEDRLDPNSTLGNSYRTFILDSDGKVISASDGTGIGTTIVSEAVIATINNEESITTMPRHFSSLRGENNDIEHARPVKNKDTGKMEKIIFVIASTEEVYGDMLSIATTIVVGMILAMVITGICGIMFSNMITAPIKTLTTNSKKLAAGDSISRIPVEASDEIGELTQSFNFMASQLGATMEMITSEKNKLEKIFEHMADGVMAFNQQGILIHVNSACYEMFGKEMMGPNFEVIFEKLGIEVEFEKLMRGEPFENGDDIVTIEDKYFKIQFDVYLNAKGEADGLVVVLQDVTKQQKLDQMRKEFVANVSHELRTPLTTVKIYTETLIDGAIDDKENAMHFLGVMEKEADRMAALVQDLLELSRIDNKQIQLSFVVLDLRDILEEVLEAQHVHIIGKGHTLHVEYDENDTFFIEGDAFRIRQVLHNILSNAVKYTDEEGKISVVMEKTAGKITISVKDTGMGIPKEDIERIFERFYRVDKARSRKLGGTGLGLSIAKELVLLHHGNIWIESEIGKGTTVFLQFNELTSLEE